MKKRFAVLAVLASLGVAWTVAAAHETAGTERGGSDGMMGQMGGMMESGMGMMGGRAMMGGNPMMGHMSGMSSRSDRDVAEHSWLGMALHHRDQIGLSADQAKTLGELRSELEKNAIRQSAETRIAEMDLAALLRAEPPDMTKAETALRRIEGLRTELRLARIKTLGRARAVLTPEQWKKLQSPGLHSAAHGGEGMMGGRGHSRQTCQAQGT